MATRRATKTYNDVSEFIQDYHQSLSQNMITLDASCYRGDELAANVKIDLKMPDGSRLGPLDGQVVFRGENRVAALRVLDMPQAVHDAFFAYDQELQVAEQARLEQERLERERQEAEEQAQMEAELGQVDYDDAEFSDDGLDDTSITWDEHYQVVAEMSSEIEQLRQQLEDALARIAELEQLGPTTKRGFQLPRLTDKQPTSQGAMSTWMPFLLQAQVHKATGIAVLQVPDVKRYVVFLDGNVVACKSEPALEEETLGQLLLSQKQITQAQLQSAMQKMQEQSIRLGQALQQLGTLTQDQVRSALNKQMEWIFQKILATQQGSFAFFACAQLPEMYPWDAVRPVSVMYKKLQSMAKTIGKSKLLQIFQPMSTHNVQISAKMRNVLALLTWNTTENSWLQQLQQPKTLQQLMQSVGLANEDFLVWLWSLGQLQILEIVPSQTQSTPIVLKIQEKWKQIQQGTHFDVLEVHWISMKNDIESKYQLLMSEFSLQNHPQVPPALQSKIPEIMQGIYQAYSVLVDDNKRRNYRDSIIERSSIEQSAKLLGQQGQQALQKADKKTAIASFSKALELIPGEAIYVQGLRQAASR